MFDESRIIMLCNRVCSLNCLFVYKKLLPAGIIFVAMNK